jgi:hypothetical protein
MTPNDKENTFELLPLETEALNVNIPKDQAACGAAWPMNDPVGLIERAQQQMMQIEDWDLSELPAGASRQHQLERQWKYRGHLQGLIKQVVDYLPSTVEGAEQFLREQN